MTKVAGLILLLIGVAGFATANPLCRTSAPEIDLSTAVSALGLLSGALLMFRSSRKE